MSVQVADLVASLRGEDSNFLAMMGLADARVGALGRSTEHSIGSIRGLGLALGTIGIGGIVESVKAAADFQTTMIHLQSNAGLTNAQMAVLSNTIKTMSAQSGAPINDLAEGLRQLAAYGYTGSAAMKILTEGMQSALSTGDNVGTVTDNLGNILHEFGIKTKDAATEMNVLHVAAQMAHATLGQFVSAAGPTLGMAANLKVPLNQVAAAMAAMTQHGFNAARANTAILQVMQRIAAPTKASEAAIRSLSRSTGIDLVGDFTQAGLASKGLSGVMDDLARATKGNFTTMAQLIPAIRGALPAFILTGNGAKDYQRVLERLNQTQKGAFDPTTTGYAAYLNSLQGQLARLRANLNVAAIDIGQVFLPALTRLFTSLQPLISAFTAFAGVHPQVIAAVLGISAAIGVLTAATFVVGPALATLFSPLGLLIAAGAVLYEAWTHDWGGIREITLTAWQALQPAFTRIESAIHAVVRAFQLGGIGAAARVALAQAGDLLGQLGDWISGTGLPYLQAHLGGWVMALWAWVQQALPPLLGALGGLLGQLGDWISGTAAPAIGAQLVAWKDAFVAWIGPATTTFLQQWPGMLSRFLDWIQSAAGPILGKLAVWAGQFIAWVVPMIPGFLKAVAAISVALAAFIVETVAVINLHVLKWIGAFIGWIAPMIPGALKALGTWYVRLQVWIGQTALSLAKDFTEMGTHLVQGLINGITSMAGNLASTVKDKIVGVVKDIPGVSWVMHSPSQLFHQYGQNVVQGLINGLASKQGDLGSAVLKMTGVVASPPGGIGLRLSASGGGFSGGNQPISVTVHSGAIQVHGLGTPADNDAFARAFAQGAADLVKQMISAQRSASSSAGATLPGVVAKR